MSLVAIAGDAATMTTAALGVTWPVDAVIVEADPRGGSLGAWMDLLGEPTLTDVVSTVLSRSDRGDEHDWWSAVEGLIANGPLGIRVVPAPIRAAEAIQAVDLAVAGVLPRLAARSRPIALVDLGELPTNRLQSETAAIADHVVLVHRQRPSSARAEAARIARLAEHYAGLRESSTCRSLLVIGDRPFEPGEIGDHITEADEDAVVHHLPEDPFTAAVLCGRILASQRKLRRSPLLRAARLVAAQLEERRRLARETRVSNEALT